jgi:hypothetical protein
MSERGRRGGGVVEVGGVEHGGDALPLAFVGQEDCADDVLVELDGQDGVQVVVGTEWNEVQVERVRIRHMTALQILRRRSNSGQGCAARALIVGIELAGE